MASSPITPWEIDGERVETASDFIFLGSKITADGDCNHEIKRHLLLGRKVMPNLDSIFKSRDITLPTKVHLVKAMFFPVVIPFSSCPQSLPASESFPMSQLFAWGGQSTGVSALASFLPRKSQGWSPSEWTGWISLQSKDSQESSPTPHFKSINSSVLSFLHSPTLTSIHDYWKNHSLD